MSGLMDSINKQLQMPGKAPELGQTEQVGGLLRAKLGKASESANTPAASNIGEQTAQQATRLGLGQIGQQSQFAGMQLGEQTADQGQQAQIQGQQHQEKISDLQSHYSQQANQILDELQNAAATMNVNQRAAKMDQAGFLIRGANENYVKELNRQGQLNRLNNSTDFKTQMAQAVFDKDTELFDSDIKFKQFINSNGRDFQVALANMSDDFALNMGHLAAQEASTAAMFSGASTALESGLKAYNTYSTSPAATPVGEP